MSDVLMPELGESITEGTITKWLKKEGDLVKKDEPLFEVSTDKIDSEVPSPFSGVLSKVLVKEGETVEVGQVLAVINESGESVGSPRETEQVSDIKSKDVSAITEKQPEGSGAQLSGGQVAKSEKRSTLETEYLGEKESSLKDLDKPKPLTADRNNAAIISSPMVRKMLREHDIDIEKASEIIGSPKITREQAQTLINTQASSQSYQGPKEISQEKRQAPSRVYVADEDEILPFSNIRKRTAEHMLYSKQVSPHAMVSKEVDFEAVYLIREKTKHDFEKSYGISLSYLPFIARAAIEALKHYPRLNSSIKDEAFIIHKSVNLSIAVDLDGEGLIVPVIHSAHLLNLTGLALKIAEIVQRARQRDLTADDISKGTFTISNPGPFNTFMTYPIINQPQVAILSSDSITRKPVVVSTKDGEAIAIHAVGILTVAFDHRAVDGAYVARFLNHIANFVAHHSWEDEF